ncbi:MAG: MFS transporter [Cytophagales bacterium]|nr:MFS transporter [Armatimonadota bacterium]
MRRQRGGERNGDETGTADAADAAGGRRKRDRSASLALFKPILLLAVTVFVDLLGFGIVIPNLPRYIEVASGTDARYAALLGGVLAASYSFTQFLFAPLWGAYSDRVGRRPIILLSQLGLGASYILFGFAGHNLWMLFAGRLLAGILSSASLGVAFAYVADVTPPEKRAAGIGILGAALGLGFTFGPAFGGFLGYVDLALPAFVAAGIALLNFASTLFRLPESLPIEARREAQKNPIRFRPAAAFWVLRSPVRHLYLLTFLVTFGFSALEQSFSFYLVAVKSFGVSQESQPLATGTILGIAGLVGIFIQGGLIERLVARFGEGPVARAGIALMALGFAIFALPTTLFWLVIGPMLLLSAGRSLTAPALSSLISRRATTGQGLTLSTSQSFDSLARTVGPVVAGSLFNYIGPTAPYAVSAVVMAGALLWGFVVRGEMVAPPTAGPDGGSGAESPASRSPAEELSAVTAA